MNVPISSEDAVQEPRAGARAFAVEPQSRARGVSRHVVIALHVATIPPAAFDALGAGQQLERAVVLRPAATRGQRLGLPQEPERTGEGTGRPPSRTRRG